MVQLQHCFLMYSYMSVLFFLAFIVIILTCMFNHICKAQCKAGVMTRSGTDAHRKKRKEKDTYSFDELRICHYSTGRCRTQDGQERTLLSRHLSGYKCCRLHPAINGATTIQAQCGSENHTRSSRHTVTYSILQSYNYMPISLLIRYHTGETYYHQASKRLHHVKAIVLLKPLLLFEAEWWSD